MALHANAVAEDCTPGVGTGGIDRDDADAVLLFAIILRQLIDQRAFAGAGCARKANGLRFAGMRE